MTTTERRRRAYLIQDPYDLDAIDLIRTIDRYFGLHPVCFYTSPKDRFYGEREFPILTSSVVEATHDVQLDDLASFAAEVADRYEIVGVIPYREDTIEVAAELCELLDLAWVPAATLRRFRDKSALKRHIRDVDPSIRVPQHRLIRSTADLTGEPVPDRFVIKPNDGFGNRLVGVFTADELDRAAAHVAFDPDETWILEEYIGGVEYHIDGQTRTGGAVTPLAVYEYIRTETNDYHTVYVGEIQCTTSDPVFDVLVRYATSVLAATGLERCPFHMEVKVDESGPCLVDLGARFASEGGANNLSRLHPDRADAFAVAAHDYLAENTFATDPVDWTVYDAQRTVLVYGVSDRRGVIESLSGIDELEARPEFVRWLVEPRPGDPVEITRDLRGAPYIVELSCTDGRPRRLIDEVQSSISWTLAARSAAPAGLRQLVERARRKAAWETHRLTRRR